MKYDTSEIRKLLKKYHPKDLASIVGTSYSNMRSIISGERRVPAWMVLTLVELSNYVLKPNKLRNDIFY